MRMAYECFRSDGWLGGSGNCRPPLRLRNRSERNHSGSKGKFAYVINDGDSSTCFRRTPAVVHSPAGTSDIGVDRLRSPWNPPQSFSMSLIRVTETSVQH
jgi:hypothetical protein